MSWAQRRGPMRPNTTSGNPPVQMYNPNQHSNSENQWQSAEGQTWHNPAQPSHEPQNYWQQPQGGTGLTQTPNANTSAQYQQYQQQDQAAHYQYGSPYEQQSYGNVQYNQGYHQHAGYGNQTVTTAEGGDTWDSWGGWGDEDNSNAQSVINQQPSATGSSKQAVADSFAADASWNWSVTDSQQQAQTSHPVGHIQEPIFPKMGDLKRQQPTKTSEVIPEDPATNLKLKTAQWSTESQPSLESSDDVLPTSESDKSHMISRSSTISHSPVSGQESLSGGLGVELVQNNQFGGDNLEILKAESESFAINPTPPPPVFGPPPQGGSEDSRNPFKRTTGISHKAASNFRPLNPPTPLTGQSVNLETLPDNSEHPDHLGGSGKSVKTQAWPTTDNNEMPINDRNQYLETGQLSDVNLAETNEVIDSGIDTLPPPGLQRMVPGQLEQSDGTGGTLDEPLPGFSRMVLGQNGSGSNPDNQSQNQFDLSEPPEGLHRMVPGESSSPETSLHQQNVEENDSEAELNRISQNPRSATIGADTPPIGQNPLPVLSGDVADNHHHVRGASISSGENRSSRGGKSKEKSEQQENRREAIEGQQDDSAVSVLANSVRNLTVGENLTDGHTSNTSLPEHSPRRHSRQESSDSDTGDRKRANARKGSYGKDKRSAEKGGGRSRDKDRERYKERDVERDRYRDKDSDRYSPDSYRDRRDTRDRRYKDRRYEEDTDYYSDKEKDRRVRDERDKDYDRKYSSLRRDKDRRRKERDPRDYRDSRRSDYYYSRYGDEYGQENRPSRPSSRSDSMHESYRESRRHQEHDPRIVRNRERERYRNREHRDVFNPYQSYAYDPYNPFYQQYQYYENLRRTNPQAYAEWYRKYYQQAAGSTASYTGEDRASVHSGRSSANDELAKDRYTRQSFYSQSSLANYYGQSHSLLGPCGLDNSSYNKAFDQTDTSLVYEEQQTSAQRLTPAKFATAHSKASIVSGKLVRILPNYPMDGQNAVVEVCKLQNFLENDSEYQELKAFPGPLVKGVTHKKQIIEYCNSKIKYANSNRDILDVESYVLMWELLILLIRQNGMVVGTDIAELLLKSRNVESMPRPPSVISNTSSTAGDRNEVSEASNKTTSDNGYSGMSILKEEEVTKKFREYLLYGSCKEALEWAMKHGLWGHALFLASKLDKRTYANVMTRFANGLTINDPLQTLYQLLSGKMPSAVTSVVDEKWGDWRPHLAMILSNPTQRPELNCRAITQLGDTLLSRGSLYAAQFCYLMAEVGFGKHDNPGTRLVLLGSDHSKPFPQFVTNEAVHMTEIYEFACGLNDSAFLITEFQFYKYMLATRLADFGLLERSLQYLEKLAGHIIANPSQVSPTLVDSVCSLADKLKFYDPVGDIEDESEFGGLLETSRPDNSWLKDLRTIQEDYQSGRIVQEPYTNYQDQLLPLNSEETIQQQPSYAEDMWQQMQQQQQQFEQQQQHLEQQYQQPQAWRQEQPVPVVQDIQQPMSESLAKQYEDQQNYWAGQQRQPQWSDQPKQYNQDFSSVDQQQENYYDNSNSQTEPQISMPNQTIGNSAFQEDPGQSRDKQEKSKIQQEKTLSPKQETKQSTGWFGGIFGKLSMRPKNQMKLPDDKNPKIIWDEAKKRWVNVDEDPNDPANELKPPPKMADLMLKKASAQVPDKPAKSSAQNEEAAPSRLAQSNMYKMQRSRNLKTSYVDVFKQNGTKSADAGVPAAPEKARQTAPPPQINFFIPQPVSDPNAPVDFLTPGGMPAHIGEQQMSRWSSTSSLSREVASYTSKNPAKNKSR